MATYAVIRKLKEALVLSEGTGQLESLIQEVLEELVPPKKQSTLKTRSPLQAKTKLKPRSEKRAKQYVGYREQRERYLKKNRVCMAQTPVCTRRSVDVHHLQKRNGDRLTDEANWMAVCRECHTYIGDHPAWAEQNGLLKRVNSA